MFRKISGFLVDIDGVLLTGNQRIPGSLRALKYLKDNKIPFLLVTNTTRKSRVTIWHHLKRAGFSVEQSQIFTAPLAAVNWLKQKGITRVYLLVTGSVMKEFKDFKITTANPEYLIIGDLGKDLSFDKLNLAFRLVMRGAKMIALQKNRYWQTSDGLTIDAGAIVAALEYATGKRALVMGKPRKQFFWEAARMLNLEPGELAMVGDDLEADVRGARKAGLFGIAVKTGKFREHILEQTKIKPDAILNSIADLSGFIRENRGEWK